MPFSSTDVGLCINHLFLWSNWNFLHNSQSISLPTQSCLVLNSFCANLLHSLMRLMVSSQLTHYLPLLFVVFYLFLLWHDWFFLRCFTLLSRETQLLSLGFFFFATSRFSCVRRCFLVVWYVHRIVFLPIFVFWLLPLLLLTLFYFTLCKIPYQS